MASPPASVLCVKCGTAFLELVSECSKCGGKTAKVCGNCSSQNSVQKKYCDKCGTSLSEIAPPRLSSGAFAGSGAPGESPVPAAAPPAEILPLTVVKSKQAPPEAPQEFSPPQAMSLPAAGRIEAGPPQPLPPEPFEPPAPQTEPRSTSRRSAAASAFLERYMDTLIKVSLYVVIGAGAYYYYLSRRPDRVLLRATENYLSCLKTWNVVGAYAFLSPVTQALLPIGEFQVMPETAAGAWRNVRIAHLEANAGLVEYEIERGQNPPTKEFLFFARENGRWAIVDDRSLVKKSKQAVANRQPDIAVIASQSAVKVNPVDPRAHGQLCESYLARGMTLQAQEECRLALSLAARYPVPIPMEHYRAIAEADPANLISPWPPQDGLSQPEETP